MKKILTAPDEKISEVENSFLQSEDMEAYCKDMTEAIGALCGHIIAKEKITDNNNSELLQNILILHSFAAKNDISYHVESVDVTSINEQIYEYTAAVKYSEEDELLTVKGKVQFNDENLIDYFTYDSGIKLDPFL